MEDKIAVEIGKAISTTLGTPLSEVSQLIADKVRFLRWKSAIKTLERAREIADKKGGSLSCPPLKFFLPFMEGCSLEPSPEDEKSSKDLTNEWANLLNSAADELKSDHLIFTRILREITAREASLLSRIVADESSQDTEISLVYESIGTFKREPVNEIIAALGTIFTSPVSVNEFLAHQKEIEREVKFNLSSRGVSTYELYFYDNFADQAVGTNPILSFSDGIYSDLDEIAVLDATDVLKYHGILDSGNFLFEIPFVLEGLPLSVSIVGASVTRLGAHFAETCISPSYASTLES
ncbi:hypothetical protein [Agrobacterium tumefaciens]|uniref:Abi-alpha family protein n=1 Tax=Agrobacterium tumefaciens TaxID=358 RepID=UPI0021D335F6|nr:hypothetical protein [Agrobacterium tumefaciens]UXS00850.1 hypothetical protein FY156_04730 [Agrobacterium tumefaciens]